jgi:hypothetical protein
VERREALTCSFHAFLANLLVDVTMLLQLKVIVFKVLSDIKRSALLVYLI